MPADRARRGARCVEEYGVERLGGPFFDIGADELGFKRQPGEISTQALKPGRRAVDRGEAGAGGGKLRRLAAGSGAQVGHAKPAHIAEQARRQGRRGVLHPPGALGKARKRRHGTMGDGPHRAGRQQAAVKLGGPRFGVALHCEIESRLMAMGSGDGTGGGLAVVLAPARHQPRRRVENGRVEGREPLRPFTREAPQYGVDETGIARRLPVRLREPHRKIDGGVIRHIEKKNLGRSDEQRGLDARRLRAAGLPRDRGR